MSDMSDMSDMRDITHTSDAALTQDHALAHEPHAHEHHAHEPHAHEPHEHDLLPELQIEVAARVCAALGDPLRLRLIELLMTGPHCVSELVAERQEAMSTISQRLKVLYDAGLLRRTREGKHIYYQIIDEPTQALLRALLHPPRGGRP